MIASNYPYMFCAIFNMNMEDKTSWREQSHVQLLIYSLLLSIYYSPDTGVEMNNKRIETTGIEGGGGEGRGERRSRRKRRRKKVVFLIFFITQIVSMPSAKISHNILSDNLNLLRTKRVILFIWGVPKDKTKTNS